MNKNYIINKIGLFAILGILAFSSCVPQKKMLLLKQVEMASENLSVEYQNERSLEYKVQPGDNLYIKAINLIDEKSSGVLNGGANGASSMNISENALYLNGYSVNKDGYIDYPLTGMIEVKNLTVEQVKERLQDSLAKYVKETAVVVKLASFDLTILGEVGRVGKYKIYQSEIGLLEALAMAGGTTDFAKTESVKIVRRTDNGSEIAFVNIGNADILSSPYYYLKPNDIIYVEPLKAKQWGFTSFPYSTVISVISLCVTLVTLYLNLSK